jgi:hypothetical protein
MREHARLPQRDPLRFRRYFDSAVAQLQLPQRGGRRHCIAKHLLPPGRARKELKERQWGAVVETAAMRSCA